MNLKTGLYLFILLAVPSGISAQKKAPYGTGGEFVQESFKTTRIVNFMTTETGKRHGLEYRISHRFGPVNSGAYNNFGIDGPAAIKFALEYSPNGRLLLGFSRCSVDKMYEGFVKFKITQQTRDNKKPVTLTVCTAANFTTLKDPAAALNGFDKYKYPSSRLSYATQLIAARKFGERITVQATGFFIHYNLVEHFSDRNDMFALGLAFRYKIRPRMAISGEYAIRLNKYSNNFSSYHNAAAIGLDIETGGHVFQFHFTNAFGMNETQFIPYTSEDIRALGIRLGFNISRMFILAK